MSRKEEILRTISLEDELQIREKIFLTKKQELTRKVKVPPVGAWVDEPKRWREVLRIKWQREEHQNVNG